MEIVYRVGYAVAGNPDFGSNSALLEAMGLTRERVRRMRIRLGMKLSAKERAKEATPIPSATADRDDAGPSLPASLGSRQESASNTPPRSRNGAGHRASPRDARSAPPRRRFDVKASDEASIGSA
jgi:hypothetical protein